MNQRRSKFAPILLLIDDPGTSVDKSVYQLSDGKIGAIATEPHLKELNPNQFDPPRFKSSLPPERQSWVKYDGKVFAVGTYARSLEARLVVNQVKGDRMIPKILSSVWCAAVQNQLPQKFSAAIAGLLPPSEMAAAERIMPQLVEALSEFETPTGVYRVKAQVDFLSEGRGISLYKEMNDPAYLDRTCVFFMIGFRNATALVTRHGVPQNDVGGRSEYLGFSHMLRLVQNSSEDQTSLEALAEAICAAGHEVKLEKLFPITRHRHGPEQLAEAGRLRQSILQARDRYLKDLLEWMDEEMPRSYDEIIFCGGTAEYLAQALTETRFRPTYMNVSFHGGVELPEGFPDRGLGCRFYDPYAALEYYSGEVFPHLLEEPAEVV
ncbi:hypothetical protein NDI52_29220 [Leptolyngbya sp. PL-A3]|uniref:hypothetical protein n=1 Tax=Leptolyngbya sp. PL-A3 TaxID=2933911 RepID=UPI003297786A